MFIMHCITIFLHLCNPDFGNISIIEGFFVAYMMLTCGNHDVLSHFALSFKHEYILQTKWPDFMFKTYTHKNYNICKWYYGWLPFSSYRWYIWIFYKQNDQISENILCLKTYTHKNYNICKWYYGWLPFSSYRWCIWDSLAKRIGGTTAPIKKVGSHPQIYFANICVQCNKEKIMRRPYFLIC